MSAPSFTIPSAISEALRIASEHLRAGDTVAVPTETVYGLAANALDPSAVRKIYHIKNRPADNPLIIHVSSLEMLRRLLPPPETYKPSKLYDALIQAFWPGPLTLLFPSPTPPPPPAPQTNAIRMPSHPLALALIHTADLPLSAPSANSSGRPSPTEARHVYNDLNGADGLGCILDGGPCGVGVESTVLNGLSWRQGGGGVVDVLRPGGLGVEEIARVVAEVDGEEGQTEILVHGKPWRPQLDQPATSSESSRGEARNTQRTIVELPSAPGMKYRHYSPRIPVFLLYPTNTFPQPPPGCSDQLSASDVVAQLASRLRKGKFPRIGLLHYDDSPLYRFLSSLPQQEYQLVPDSLGPTTETAAQRLFASMLRMEGEAVPRDLADDHADPRSEAVDAIFIEGCLEAGMGLAVMERAEKAAGGASSDGHLAFAGSGARTYWVHLKVG